MTPTARVTRSIHEDLQTFALRMGQDGLCISRTFMLFDRRYALEQLRLAHASADDALRELAMGLFRRLEPNRPTAWLVAKS